MQGYTDLTSKPKWDGQARTLSGTSKLVAGEPYRVILANNGFEPVGATVVETDSVTARLSPIPGHADLAELALTSKQGGPATWAVTYK